MAKQFPRISPLFVHIRPKSHFHSGLRLGETTPAQAELGRGTAVPFNPLVSPLLVRATRLIDR